MVETLAEMKKLRRGATTEDFNKQTFAEQMITRIRNVKSEIVNAQGTVMTIGGTMWSIKSIFSKSFYH